MQGHEAASSSSFRPGAPRGGGGATGGVAPRGPSKRERARTRTSEDDHERARDTNSGAMAADPGRGPSSPGQGDVPDRRTADNSQPSALRLRLQAREKGLERNRGRAEDEEGGSARMTSGRRRSRERPPADEASSSSGVRIVGENAALPRSSRRGRSPSAPNSHADSPANPRAQNRADSPANPRAAAPAADAAAAAAAADPNSRERRKAARKPPWGSDEVNGEAQDPEHPNNYNKRGPRSKDRRYAKLGIAEKYISKGMIRKVAQRAGVKRMGHTTHFDYCELTDKLVDNIVMNANIIKRGRSSKITTKDVMFVCKHLHNLIAGDVDI